MPPSPCAATGVIAALLERGGLLAYDVRLNGDKQEIMIERELRSVGVRDARVRRAWPRWIRITLAVVVVVVFFKAYAGWHWSQRVGSGPGVTFSPTKAYVARSSTLALLVDFLSEMLGRLPTSVNRIWAPGYWHLAYALGTVLPAALIGVIAYVLLSRWRGGDPLSADGQSRCRRCSYILNGLSKPRCPECGETV